MPRYYCDYCDIYIQFDSYTVRKQHNAGFNHKANVREYYSQFLAPNQKPGQAPPLPGMPKPQIMLPRPPPRPGMAAPLPVNTMGAMGAMNPYQVNAMMNPMMNQMGQNPMAQYGMGAPRPMMMGNQMGMRPMMGQPNIPSSLPGSSAPPAPPNSQPPPPTPPQQPPPPQPPQPPQNLAPPPPQNAPMMSMGGQQYPGMMQGMQMQRPMPPPGAPPRPPMYQ